MFSTFLAPHGRFGSSRLLLQLLLVSTLLFVASGQSRNIRVAWDGVIVATQSFGNGLLISEGELATPSEIPLPSGVGILNEVAVTTLAERQEFGVDLIFALGSTSNGFATVCSYTRNLLITTFVGCRPDPVIAVNPFTGLSARRGTILVSGGTGGLSVLTYNLMTGEIDDAPIIINEEFPTVIGFPDGEMFLNSSLAALSTDFATGNNQFGTAIVELPQTSGQRPRILHDFRVPGSLGFNLIGGPTNFPVVNCFYQTPDSQMIMYTANGALTMQNPLVPDSTQVIDLPMENLEAVTCAVDQEKGILAVGAIQGFSQSFIVQFPSLPSTEGATVDSVSGRIASVGANAGTLAYVTTTENGIFTVNTVGLLCFSGESTVMVSQGAGTTPTAMKLKDLELGQRVQVPQAGPTESSSFEPVYGWAHMEKNKLVTFLKLHFQYQDATTNAIIEESLEVTPSHIVNIFNQDAKAVDLLVPASEVRVGNILKLNNAGGLQQGGVVKAITTVNRRGYYAPLTPGGQLYINQVAVSCYAVLGKETKLISTLAGNTLSGSTYGSLFHVLGHLWFSPYRLQYNQFGITSADRLSSASSSWLVELPRMALNPERNAATQAVCMVLLLLFMVPFLLGCWIIENLMLAFGALCSSPAMVASGLLAAALARRHRAINHSK